MIAWKDFDDLMIEWKNFDDEHLDLDNSSASDDRETSADAEANLKMMTNGNAGEWTMAMQNGLADRKAPPP